MEARGKGSVLPPGGVDVERRLLREGVLLEDLGEGLAVLAGGKEHVVVRELRVDLRRAGRR